LGSIVAQFLPADLTSKISVFTKGPKPAPTNKLPVLTREQKNVINRIVSTKDSSSFLLHGDTGTGKTRVYLEMTVSQLAKGRSVLILTPEIGLTPQLVDEFEKTISKRVLILHSNLTNKQRRDAWLEVLKSQEPVVVIGPRSALFAPFNNLGLIVMDEAHDSAYKQDQAPYYQSIRLAGKLANLHKAIFIVGSATPNIVDYYVATAKNTPILRMQELAIKNSHLKTKILTVNSRDKSLFSRTPYFSDSLLKAIEQRLEHGEQSLMFLNRRGTARQILCQNCGWQAVCPNCDLPLTYHSDSFVLRCHTCGYKTDAISNCPVCASADIIYKNIGTKAVVESLTRFFPRARIQRFDSDSKKAERFEQHYQQIAAGDVDILVGTQILVKGLDLPKLSLVGILAADNSLSFPDYTAEERTFQLLSQIIGRVGRGHLEGTAIIQTYHPEATSISAAINKDWQGFYEAQIKERKKFLFPPFCYLLKLTCTRKSPVSARKTAQELALSLHNLSLKIQILGPSPSFYEKSNKGYSWQLVIKSKDRSSLLKVVEALPSNWSYDLDPADLL